jgi:3-oxoacid CoA-transferase subunit A
MNKVFNAAKDAIHDIHVGSSILMGGFGLTGVPENLINALVDRGTSEITCISNEAGLANFGIGRLLGQKQISKMICSYIGENHLFEELIISGHLEALVFRLFIHPQESEPKWLKEKKRVNLLGKSIC